MTRLRGAGEGSVYRRPNRRGGLDWYIWWWAGKDHRLVARALHKRPEGVKERDALRLLRERLKEKCAGKTARVRTARMTVGRLLDAHAADREVAGIKSLRQMRNEHAALKGWIGDVEVATLSGARLTELAGEYLKAGRVGDGQRLPLARRTVQTRLSWLHAAMVYGAEKLDLPPVPRFPRLKLPPIRQVEIQPAEFEEKIRPRLRAHDPADDIATGGFLTGWRISEVLWLEWDRVGREPWSIRLDDSKNGRPRWRRAEPELQTLLAERWSKRILGCPFVFHRKGQRVSSTWFYRRWRAACAEVGVPDRRFHDFRRGGYGQLMNAGVGLFEVIGHESLSVAKRYNVVDQRRQEEALRKLTAWRSRERHSRNTRVQRTLERQVRHHDTKLRGGRQTMGYSKAPVCGGRGWSHKVLLLSASARSNRPLDPAGDPRRPAPTRATPAQPPRSMEGVNAC